eukprot:GHRR01036518.1.p1 GENE.GHRR01036518.1~~GHRR01036518.1.p1  ORF type:complete len:129 (-),score=40.60 GHRR01036518.1:37-423(-)
MPPADNTAAQATHEPAALTVYHMLPPAAHCSRCTKAPLADSVCSAPSDVHLQCQLIYNPLSSEPHVPVADASSGSVTNGQAPPHPVVQTCRGETESPATRLILNRWRRLAGAAAAAAAVGGVGSVVGH